MTVWPVEAEHDMRQHVEVFRRVQEGGRKYFISYPIFEAVVAFIQGYNMACEGALLLGFREWLIVRLGDGLCLTWPDLVLRVAFPDSGDPLAELTASAEGERTAVDTVWRLFFEFEAALEERGLNSIVLAYSHWYRERYGNDPMPRTEGL